MMRSGSRSSGPRFARPITAAVAGLAIFIVDLLTPPEIAISWAYVLVVLMAAQFLRPRGVVYAAVGCVALTVGAALFDIPPDALGRYTTLANRVFSILAIALTAFLGVRGQLADRALREQADLLDLTYDIIFSRRMDGTITFWNRAAEQLYGWTREEAVNRRAHDLLRPTLPESLESITATLIRGGRWEGELVNRTRDSREVIVTSRWSLQTDKDGHPLAILETHVDVTERRHTQQALDEAQASLARVNRVMLVGEMTASIAHEINQPLTGVVANAGTCLRWLALEPPDLDEVRHYLGLIVRDGNRASAVIGRIRGLVRKQPPKAERLDVNDALAEVLALTNSDLQKNGVAVRTRFSPSLPIVVGDRVQVQQVMLNLIVNASEAMTRVDDRPRQLEAVTGTTADESDVFVEVRDSGPGLDPNSVNSLFDSFFTTKTNGMGMGLSISRSIVEAHGGHLVAEPNKPHGAVFRFTVPLEGEQTLANV
jgi:two-component system sensor kinase FixL